LYGGDLCRLALLVEEDRVADVVVGCEVLGVAELACADCDHSATGGFDLALAKRELGGVRATVDAAEVTEKDNHDRDLLPKVAESSLAALSVG
jgi:hypothetical protein